MIPLVHGTRGSGRLAKFVANCEPAVKAKQGSRSIALWKFREAVQLFGSIGGKGNLFARSRCSTVTEGRSKGPVSSLITEFRFSKVFSPGGREASFRCARGEILASVRQEERETREGSPVYIPVSGQRSRMTAVPIS